MGKLGIFIFSELRVLLTLSVTFDKTQPSPGRTALSDTALYARSITGMFVDSQTFLELILDIWFMVPLWSNRVYGNLSYS